MDSQDRFVVEFAGPAAEVDADVRSLVAWLAASDGLRGAASVRMRAPGIGEQGGAADAAVILAGIAPLAVPVFGWLSERVKVRRIRLKAVRTCGEEHHELELEAGSPQDVSVLLPQLARFFDQQPPA